MLEANMTMRPPLAFETLDVTVGTQSRPMEAIPKHNHYFNRMGVHLTISRLNKVFWTSGPAGPRSGQTTIGGLRRELVMIKCPSARILVVSSPATEYYGVQSDLMVKYAHLDIVILDMKDRASIKGILPELWGIRKMSNETKALLKPPWEKPVEQEAGPAVFSV